MYKEEEIRKLIYQNLERIYNAESQSLHKSAFIDMDKNKLENPNDLIGIMAKLDLIETEVDDDIYFLTEIGFEYIENNAGWYWGELPSYYEAETNTEDIDYRAYASDETTVNHTKGKKYVWLLLAVVIAIFYIFIYNGKPKKDDFNLSPKLIKELDRIHDSLRKTNPQDSTYVEVIGDSLIFHRIEK